MKKKILFVFAVLMLLVGCGTTLDSPTKKVEELLNKYQTNDSEIVSQIDTSILESDELTDEQKESYKEVILNQYSDLTYEVIEETIDGNKATVEVEIEVYDYTSAINDANSYLEEHESEFLDDDGNLDLVSYIDYKLDTLFDYKDRITYTITFNLTREDSNSDWVVEDLSDTDLQKIHGVYAN